jgi:hypothetical protein
MKLTREQATSAIRLNGIVLESLSEIRHLEGWFKALGIETKITPSPMGYTLGLNLNGMEVIQVYDPTVKMKSL